MNPDAATKSLTPERWQRIESVFCAALDTPEASRAGFLRAACAGDETLLAEVENLLHAFESEKRFKPPSGNAPAAGMRGCIGETIGEYRLDAELGHGGMGTVYLASRADGEFEQQVALKVVSPHLRTQFFDERFRAERQILANLNHPNITRLLDGGLSAAGDPYLVMEYVDGQPISRFCDERQLPVEERIRLFLEACSAVEYAHRNLVVHRDLKPGNLLVTKDGVPKLLDFGTAKLLLAAPSDRTATAFSALTPRYASPEQLRGEPVSTSMDVYSLGVMLYELVVGAWPFGDPDSAIAGFERAVRDVDPAPPRSLITGESARLRSTTKARLERVLDGDLRRILAKAMDADARQRYSSVEHFSGDLRRYLKGEPVLARPGTVWYRFQKSVRRHKLAVGAALAFVAVLTGATVYSVRQAQAARREAAKAALVARFMEGILASVDPLVEGGKRDMTVREALDLAAKRLDELNPEPAVKGPLLSQLGVSFQNLEDFAKAEVQFRKALALARQIGTDQQVAFTEAQLAQVLYAAGKNPDEAESLFRDASSRAIKIGKDANPRLYQSAVGEYSYFIWKRYGHSAPMAKLALEALDLARTNPLVPRPWLVIGDHEFSEYLMEENRDEEAEKLLNEGISVERNFARPTASLSSLFAVRSLLRLKHGDDQGAEEFARQSRDEAIRDYGAANPAISDQAALWAYTLMRLGRTSEALTESEKALDIARQDKSAKAGLCWPLTVRAYVLNGVSRFRDAEPLAREALADFPFTPADNPLDPQRARTNAELGIALAGQLRFQEAIAPLEASERTFLALAGWGPKNYETIRVHDALSAATPRR